MNIETAQKLIEKLGGTEKAKEIIKNCPKECAIYREAIGSIVIKEIPIGVIATALAVLGVENDGVTNNGWISVDDEPPPELEEVLTLSIMNTYQILSLQNDGEYFDFARRESVRAGYITHWQPLPQPPKERMNDNH